MPTRFRPVRSAPAPIFLIIDGHPTHQAKPVARFVAEQDGGLALFHLPSYSPALSPDELVWNNPKNHGTGRRLITSAEQPRQTIVAHRRQLQKLPALLCRFFHAPITGYASAQWQSIWEHYEL